MTLEILLNIDDLNFKVQEFTGSGICQFSKHNNKKQFVFSPNKYLQQYDLEQVKKIATNKVINNKKRIILLYFFLRK